MSPESVHPAPLARLPAPAAPAVRRLRWPRNGWATALLAAVFTVALQWLLQPDVDSPLAWVLPYPAVLLVALRHGVGPALLTAVFCGLGATFSVPAAGRLALALPTRWAVFGLTAVVAALVCSQARLRRRLGRELPRADTPPAIETPLTRWLEAVIWGAVLLPLALFAGACGWSHAAAIASGQERVTRMNTVTLRHAERTFATAAEVVRKARDLATQPDAQLRAGAAEVRQRLQDMMLGLSAVQAITVWDADGRGTVSTLLNPTFPQASIADRPYFDQARRGSGDVFVTDPIDGRISGVRVVNVVGRRSTPDGQFAGVIVVSLFPNYFQEFYQSLASEESGIALFALFSSDGAVLARWPPAADGNRVPADSKLAQAVRAGATAGTIRLNSKFDSRPRTISFMRLPNLPIHASAALDESVMFQPWYRFVTLLAAVLGPLTAGLVYVSWLALQKTRREQVVLLELQAEMRRRAQTERALAQAQRLEALSVLTGGVAHDFNNLLAIINGNIHMIGRHHPEVGAGRHLAAVSRAVASGARLTRQLLSFARRQALKPEQIVLQTWLPGVADLLQSTIGPGVALDISVAPDVPPIRVDAGELELALINLATNAKDAMNEQGRLCVNVTRSVATPAGGSSVEIRVADTGSGIPAALLAKVFEPFFTTKPSTKGTGLGLSQVHGFCLQAGGDVSAASSEGGGTVITMSFPADESVAAPAVDHGGSRSAKRLRGCVLVVEDNADIGVTHRELLEAAGLVVDVAANGEDALRCIDRDPNRHQLVLSDISMPGAVDGIDLAARLKRSRPMLPVVLVTGYAARLGEAQALGRRVLAKPVDPDLLLAEVESALERQAVAA